MTIFDMLGQSGSLTILGMGIVFGFLVIMVFCVTCMGKIVHALGADKDLNVAAPDDSNQVSNAAKSTAVNAAIVAAVTEYQKENG